MKLVVVDYNWKCVMNYSHLLRYSIRKENLKPSELLVEREDIYTIKVFSSGIVVRFPFYAQDIKCYEEKINCKQVHIIKGNNAEILVVPMENTVVIGNNNTIYCIGGTDTIIVKGSGNCLYDIDESIKHYNYDSSSKIEENILNQRGRAAQGVKEKIIDISDLRNMWNSVNAYFA